MPETRSSVLIVVSSGAALVVYFARHLQQLHLIFRFLLGDR
jgi:hypothetical protein